MNPNSEDLACQYVLDRMDTSEREAFEALMLLDPKLEALVRELESALARHIHALPQVDVPGSVMTGIESRIDELQAKRARAITSPVASKRSFYAGWGIAAVFAIGLGTGGAEYLLRKSTPAASPILIIVGLDSHTSVLATVPLQGGSQGPDARFIQLATLAEQYWERPGDLPVKLQSTEDGGLGYALFDPTDHTGFIAIRQIPIIEHGKRYCLWILNKSTGKAREAGSLPLEASKGGLYSFSVSPESMAGTERPAFFVTAEDVADLRTNKPTGKIVLGGGSPF